MENFTITNRTQEVADKELNKMFDKLVPASGKAKTKAGEIVRAMARLAYRWYNDGDKLGVGYGKQTCNPAGRFLAYKVRGADPLLVCIYDKDDETYEKGLLEVQNYIIDYILAHPELKKQKNDEDFWDWREDEEEW